MTKEDFLEKLKHYSIKEINKIIEENGKKPKRICPFMFRKNNHITIK